jgi:acyl-homoserine lactone acylase PvdQ
MKKVWLVLLVAALLLEAPYAAAPPAHSAQEATILRDAYGVPHIFAPTLEAAAFAVGYAQAEDRLEELLKNFRRAAGTMAEAFGAEHYISDLTQRIWRHREISRERYAEVSPKMRAVVEAYIAGVKRYLAEHPEKLPAWAKEQPLEPWDVVALGRFIIWGWPLGQAVGELRAAGIPLTPPPYRGSNQMLIAASRTSAGAPVAIVDPHLSWYGEFRFYQSRIYTPEFNAAGVSILGAPLPSLGHSAYASVAMTTGGPDTSDVFEEEVNPENPRQYRHDGAWREMSVRRERIGVREGERVAWREVEIESTRHGPVVARRGTKAYALALPYADEVGLGDQLYEMMQARNLAEMKRALARLQLMPQNVMVGTVDGDLYYVRNGRVPVRPKGVDPSKPIPGHTSAHDWQGLHKLEELVQVTNPRGGWMQNCNVSPFAMMKQDAPAPEEFAERPYLYNAGRAPAHQRGAMVNDVLDAWTRVTPELAAELAFYAGVWRAERWQARLREAWERAPESTRAGDPAGVYALVEKWDRHSRPDSEGALAYYAFKLALGLRPAEQVEPPAALTDEQLLAALAKAAEWLRSNFGELRVPYGRYFRVGRAGGRGTWPVGGGTLGAVGMSTPRAIGFALAGKEMVGRSGQTSTQVVILSKPPVSYSVVPLGHSDDPASPHFDDQAEKLFSQGRVAPTFFLNRAELEKHVTARKVLKVEAARAAAAR